MPGKVFLDANVLIYAQDAGAPRKQRISCDSPEGRANAGRTKLQRNRRGSNRAPPAPRLVYTASAAFFELPQPRCSQSDGDITSVRGLDDQPRARGDRQSTKDVLARGPGA